MEMFGRDDIDYEVMGHYLYEIVNFNEYFVIQAIKEIYEENDDLCPCHLCIEDTYALALNSLPPRYIQVTSKEVYLENQGFLDEKKVKRVVLEAVEKVRNNPKH